MLTNNHHHVIDTIELKKIDVQDLQIGMFVSELDRPWLETNFWFQGFLLKNQQDIQAVQDQCHYVYIDVRKQSTLIPQYSSPPAPTPEKKPAFYNPVQPNRSDAFLKQQINHAEILHRNTSTVVKSFMEEAKFGRTINTVLAKKSVATCVDTLFEAPNTLLLMTQLKALDSYTAQHSMNVCIYALALGRQLNLSRTELNNLGLCGMMHDMGKMRIPYEILTKPHHLSRDERLIMETHTTEGSRLLMNTTALYKEVVEVAYMHHERLDGIGYPRQLKATQITPYAQMVAIVDIYDAMTSNRVYRKGMSHLDAIKILNDSAQAGHLNQYYTLKFIECLGVYPVGCLVQLRSGEIGLVLESNRNAKLKPKIMILKDANDRLCNEYIIDLAMMSENNAAQHYEIQKIIQPDECGIDLFKYYASGSITGFELF
ncbi:HD-GYP domain-containing protein [Methylomonas sp. AM2-LC]|uniref:HD-GYP domain-containing protein n=1 Tax=Methylomonas sp. AM2-LC TaxID=3153301 RepID=UPI003267195D